MRPRILDEPVETALRPILADLQYEQREGSSSFPASEVAAPRWPQSYEQVRPLGRGGMGRTVLARERSTGRLVCVKELYPEVDLRTLVQEHLALSRLTHPNIVRVLRMEPESRPPFLVSEYIEGMDLRSYALESPPKDEAAIAQLVQPVAAAIAYLHANAIIHRDLKPENIIVESRGDRVRPVVIDLGISIVDRYDHEENLTAAGRIMGSPVYMAPEQVAGEVLTPAVDVYALGIMLFELAAGRMPFRGSLLDVFAAKAQRKEGVELPDGFFRKRWRRLAPLVRSCTEPRKARRPSAADVAAALDLPI